MDWEQIISSLNLTRERVATIRMVAIRVTLVLAAAYVVATGVSAYLMTGLTSSALSSLGRLGKRSGAATSLNLAVSDNYRDIEKAVRDRNLFNSTGEFPDESKPDSKNGDKAAGTFDINAACSKPTLNVQLVGTIYLESGTSVATLQEQGYSESDIYKEGDLIVGNDQATIVKIERNRVILNNNGIKECLELASSGPKNAASGFPDVSASQPPPDMSNGTAPDPGSSGGGGEVTLEEKYVQDELGPGFGTIIQKARLVPNTTDNQMNGFKIFAIDQSSMLGKIGFQNGDIITQVNETSLKQPEQGFAVYQALQDEREVRFHILRRGTTPMTITVRVK